jgi:hypothetical protein
LTEAVGPGYVDARDHAAIHAHVSDQGMLYDSVRTVLGLPIRLAIGSLYAPTEPLGKFLAEMAMGKFDAQLDEGGSDIVTIHGGLRIVKNAGFQRLSGLS